MQQKGREGEDQIQYFLGNPNIKRSGVVTNFTKEQIQEYARCMKSPIYFIKKYIKIIHIDKGLTDFDLYPYQEDMIEQYESNRFNITLSCRQSGKSASMCAYLLWNALFKSEQNIFVLANKGATAREMIARITLMLENLPFFLQPGCKALNKGSIEFSNNSKIISAATSSSSIRGMSANLIALDEFAFVERAEEFFTSTYPVISSGKTSKVIIVSTPNGIGNMYHKLWEGAVQGTNEFKPFTINWWNVPGRDEEWKKQTISNTSELQFQQEFEVRFLGNGSTLISGDKLLQLRADTPIYTQGSLKMYEKPVEGHSYMMFVDVAKGRGQDYSTFNIIDMSVRPFKQVCVYRDNMISPLLLPDIIWKYAKVYNHAYVIIESNDQGMVVCNGLYYDLEYENMFVESTIKTNGLGVMMNKKIKRIGCSNLKDLIEEDKFTVVDPDTIIELSTFEAKGTSFEASPGNHDDLVMNLVLMGWFVTNPFFQELTDIDTKNMIHEQNMKAIEDELVPFGFFSSNAYDSFEYEAPKEYNFETGEVIEDPIGPLKL